jgi:mono/diheme cytochrome c family protein
MRPGTCLAGSAAILTIAWSAAVGAAPDQQTMVETMWKARGASVYKRECAKCHGSGGAGGKSAPALNRKPLTEAKVLKIVSAGKPPKMPGFKTTLSAGQIKALGKYVSGLKPKK